MSGRARGQTAPIATAAAEDFAPVALLALLKHPLVGGEGDERLRWLDQVRALDLALPAVDRSAAGEYVDARGETLFDERLGNAGRHFAVGRVGDDEQRRVGAFIHHRLPTWARAAAMPSCTDG